MRSGWAWLILALTLPAAGAEDCPPGIPGMVCADVAYRDSPARLCVIGTLNAGPEWFVVTDGPLHEKIAQPPPVSMSQVAELQVSPGQKYLAVVSVGEGHPFLDVFDLPALLRDRPQEALYSLNPYPGGVAVERWLDEARLALAYESFGEAGPPEIPACADGTLVLDMPGKHLVCARPALK